MNSERNSAPSPRHPIDVLGVLRSGGVRRLLLYFAAANAFTLVFLGVAFHIILLGLTLAFLGLARVYDPAYQLFRRISSQSEFPVDLVRSSKRGVIYPAALLISSLLILAFGVLLVSYSGLCNQNFLCLVLRHAPR